MTNHILYIDDNATNLEFIQRLLKRGGYSCLIAQHPNQGIKIAQEYNPPLILLDIQMPDMSGYDVLDHLRQMPQFETTPIIAITANAMDGERARIMQAGFDAYLPKPVYRVELFKLVGKYVERIC